MNILLIIIGWFVAGFLINVFFYGGKPDYQVGTSNGAKTLHIIVNIITVIMLLRAIF